jgi:hypothetical protein
MQGKPASVILLFLLFVSALVLAHNIQPVKSYYAWTGTIYIGADGSISPPTAPISSVDNVTYTLTDNIVGNVPDYTSAIVIGRENITIDGAGYTLQCTRPAGSTGIDLSEAVNVTVQRVQIEGFNWGISDISISSYWSRLSKNTISRNNITNNVFGICFELGAGNRISENNIANNYIGIELDEETYTTDHWFPWMYYDSVFGNNIANNHFGIGLFATEYCRIYHNNFMGNYQQAGSSYTVAWDLGYPQGGNYWSDYNGTDLYSGPYQNETGGDGIGDTPYIIDSNNFDLYPLMPHDVAVTSVTVDRAWVCQGLSASINVTVLNKGDFDENATVILYYNTTANVIIGAQNMTLSLGQNETIAFVWDTTGVPYCQNYTLTAVATIPLDNKPADNTLACEPINVRIMGDINGDDKADGKDLGATAQAFASYAPNFLYAGSPAHSRWNPDADLNLDNKIDGKDLGTIAENFGK